MPEQLPGEAEQLQLTKAERNRAAIRRDPFVFLATACWIGFLPIAPGTAGAGLGVVLAVALAQIPWLWLHAAVVVALCVAGVPICTMAARRLQQKDPCSVVYDEVSSMAITLFMAPVSSPSVLIAGFALHRLFDITKLPPARQFERFPEGLGIQADDWVAGLYSFAVLQILLAAGLLPAGY